MKAIISFLFLIFLTGSIATAQEKRDTIHSSVKTAPKTNLKSELGLTREQAKKLKEVNKEFKSESGTLKSDSTVSENERKEKQKKLVKDRQAKINAILTPDQQEKFKQFQKQRKKSKLKSQNSKVETF